MSQELAAIIEDRIAAFCKGIQVENIVIETVEGVVYVGPPESPEAKESDTRSYDIHGGGDNYGAAIEDMYYQSEITRDPVSSHLFIGFDAVIVYYLCYPTLTRKRDKPKIGP